MRLEKVFGLNSRDRQLKKKDEPEIMLSFFLASLLSHSLPSSPIAPSVEWLGDKGRLYCRDPTLPWDRALTTRSLPRVEGSVIFLLCEGWRLNTHIHLWMYINFISRTTAGDEPLIIWICKLISFLLPSSSSSSVSFPLFLPGSFLE